MPPDVIDLQLRGAFEAAESADRIRPALWTRSVEGRKTIKRERYLVTASLKKEKGKVEAVNGGLKQSRRSKEGGKSFPSVTQDVTVFY